MFKEHSLSRRIRIGLSLLFLGCLLGEYSCLAVTPGAVIEIVSRNSITETIFIFTSEADFGPKLHFGKPSASYEDSSPTIVTLPPTNNPFLCDKPKDDEISILKDSIVVVPQGKCTYKSKVRNAGLLGARHAVVYNTLSSKYHSIFEGPTSMDNILYPSRYVDYDCNNGEAWIPREELEFEKLPYDDNNDKLLSGPKEDGNLCAVYHDVGSHGGKRDFRNTCESQRCVFTGRQKYDALRQDIVIEACCAWDMYTLMGDDDSADDVQISSSYLTMREGERLLNMLQDEGDLQAIVYARWYPTINISNVLICILASFTVWYSSWMAAKLYRDLWRALLSETIEYDGENPPLRNVAINDETLEYSEVDNESAEQMIVMNSDTNESSQQEDLEPTITTTTNAIPNDSNEVSNNQHQTSAFIVRSQQRGIRALSNPRFCRALIIFGSVLLVIIFLFFARLPDVVIVSYGIAGSFAIGHLLIYPFLERLSERTGILKTVTSPLCTIDSTFVIQSLDVMSTLCVVALSGCWIWLGFSQTDAKANPFYWIIQNIMGFSICVELMVLFRFDNIKIPTLFMLVTFFFNAFFTISMAFFAEEVLKPSDGLERIVRIEKDFLRCEKYQNLGDITARCATDRLPLAFAIPMINDYRGGWSSLGLVNILVPGLLCAFLARYDAAKNVMKCLNARERAARRGLRNATEFHTSRKTGIRRLCWGYFCPVLSAYSFSLFWAVIGYYLTGRNQQTLIYIVPLTLGTMLAMAKLKGDVISFWEGPRRLVLSQILVYIIARNGIGRIGIQGIDDENFTADTSSVISSESDVESSTCDGQDSTRR
mmetsp:Transcript_6150/g.11660  ORF Transcript_6150/g.11660 Transcript_6150/m.11660 type:complete len:824 (-) Transcript_6150:3827-6298(-)